MSVLGEGEAGESKLETSTLARGTLKRETACFLATGVISIRLSMGRGDEGMGIGGLLRKLEPLRDALTVDGFEVMLGVGTWHEVKRARRGVGKRGLPSSPMEKFWHRSAASEPAGDEPMPMEPMLMPKDSWLYWSRMLKRPEPPRRPTPREGLPGEMRTCMFVKRSRLPKGGAEGRCMAARGEEASMMCVKRVVTLCDYVLFR